MKIRLFPLFLFTLCAARAQLVPGNGTGLSVDANTVALFHFEDAAATALDSSGNNRNATVSNTSTGSGLFGTGRVFNGTNDRLEFGSAFDALSGGSGWTIEYFAKSDDGANVPFFVNHNPSAGWYLVPRSGDILYWIKTSAAGNSWAVQATATGVTPDTAWHYYAMTWTPGSISVYRDGVLAASAAVGGSWAGSNSFGVWLDFDSFNGSYGGAGTVDDIRFSNVARSALEIQTAYNVAAIPEPATDAAFAGLGAFGLALWRRRARTTRI
jgi:hypothetical protein